LAYPIFYAKVKHTYCLSLIAPLPIHSNQGWYECTESSIHLSHESVTRKNRVSEANNCDIHIKHLSRKEKELYHKNQVKRPNNSTNQTEFPNRTRLEQQRSAALSSNVQHQLSHTKKLTIELSLVAPEVAHAITDGCESLAYCVTEDYYQHCATTPDGIKEKCSRFSGSIVPRRD